MYMYVMSCQCACAYACCMCMHVHVHVACACMCMCSISLDITGSGVAAQGSHPAHRHSLESWDVGCWSPCLSPPRARRHGGRGCADRRLGRAASNVQPAGAAHKPLHRALPPHPGPRRGGPRGGEGCDRTACQRAQDLNAARHFIM